MGSTMNKAMSFDLGKAGSSATLTEVLSMCFNNVDRALPPADCRQAEPPFTPIELDYPPISAQPEYAAEAAKLNRFAAQREQAIEKLEALQLQFASRFKAEVKTEDGVIAKAESLLAGDLPRDIQAEMTETSRIIEALREAIEAQHGVLRRVADVLSRAAGRRYSEEHKQRVKRLMDAVVELHAANQAEMGLQGDLIRLGYFGSTVPGMRLSTVEDPFDSNGNMAYYWYREALQYTKTDAELAAGVRKARLAAAIG
jgi:hypothetical protein